MYKMQQLTDCLFFFRKIDVDLIDNLQRARAPSTDIQHYLA